MSAEIIYIYHPDPAISSALATQMLGPRGYKVFHFTTPQALAARQADQPADLVLLSCLPNELDQAEFFLHHPLADNSYPIILLVETPVSAIPLAAVRLGVVDVLNAPYNPQEVLNAASRAFTARRLKPNQAGQPILAEEDTLQMRVAGLETLHGVGRQVTATLNLDEVLAEVVNAAVELTGAEEGSLLLLDSDSGQLYMRAARNFQEEFVRTFRLPVQESLSGQVLKTGQPLLINAASPQKIQSGYLFYSMIYVPLKIHERAIGVLQVDTRSAGKEFTQHHQILTTALADYAAVAIENARLYHASEQERSKYENLLANIQDGVLVVDEDLRLVLCNRAAAQIFQLNQPDCLGAPIVELVNNEDLLNALNDPRTSRFYQTEIHLEDERTFNAHFTPIPGLGLAVALQDITHLKNLDRIKSDFVNTVSHDLRSPLTAILGYVELLDRVGPLNAQQQQFIQRIELSVNTITALINDLLDLGRIEAGFDTRLEVISTRPWIEHTLGNMLAAISEKGQVVITDLEPTLPPVLGNPLRLQQMLTNLIDNAHKYAPPGGQIHISARSEGDQFILQVSDDGPGIPGNDQPYIFDRFYRASNVAYQTPGTGLGLAIVKSIVDLHHGRIWVDSTPDNGSTFTIVLPVSDQEL